MLYQGDESELFKPYRDGSPLYPCSYSVPLDVLEESHKIVLLDDCSLEFISPSLPSPSIISPLKIERSLWAKWFFDHVSCSLYDSQDKKLSSSPSGSILRLREGLDFKLNQYGVFYDAMEGKPRSRCDNVLDWSEFCKCGYGQFVINPSISSLVDRLARKVNLVAGQQYYLEVSQFELTFDQAFGSAELQRSMFELLRQHLKDNPFLKFEREGTYTSPFTQFCTHPHSWCVERLKLYLKTTSRGGSILRFEYAWDCREGNVKRLPENVSPLVIDLIAQRKRNSVYLVTPDGQPAAVALRDTLLQKGLEGFFPIWLYLSQPMK